MLEPTITVTGNLGETPVLRSFNDSAVATLRVASTPRIKDKATEVYRDGTTMWFDVSVWGRLAENCTASLQKGDRVAVTGRLTSAPWTDSQGAERSSLVIEAITVALDLGKHRALVVKAPPLLVTADPAARSTGVVDTETGEVLMEEDTESVAA